MQSRHTRPLAVVVLISIIIYGILRTFVLKIYSQTLSVIAQVLGVENNWLFQSIKKQARIEAYQEQTLGWLIYYPTYFLLHIMFIYLLFNKNTNVRNYLMIGLSSLIGLIIFFWVLFVKIDEPQLASFFRIQFRNLFGLPFILLAIEGGRILYKDIAKLI